MPLTLDQLSAAIGRSPVEIEKWKTEGAPSIDGAFDEFEVRVWAAKQKKGKLRKSSDADVLKKIQELIERGQLKRPDSPDRNNRKVDATRDRRARERDIGEVSAPKDPRRKDRARLSLLRFLEDYFPHRFPLAWSIDHLALIESIQGIIRHGGLRAIAMPRGSGKTTIIECAALWALLFAHRQSLMIVAATSSAARQILSNIQSELGFNDLLDEDFNEATLAIRALGGVSRRAESQTCMGQPTHLAWTKESVRLPVMAAGGGSVITISGITGAIRGTKVALADGTQVRPDLCIVDDFQTRESAKSVNQTASRLQVMRSDILGLAGPGVRVACLCACTIITKDDGAAQLLDRKLHPEWQGTTAKLMRSMPSPKSQALWDQYAEIYREDLSNDALPQEVKLLRATALYRKNRARMDEGADPGWPERKSEGEESAIQHAMNLLLTRGDDAFFAEYQNDPRDLATTEAPQLEAAPIAQRLNRIKPGVVPGHAQELVSFIDVGEGCLWWGVAGFGDAFRGDLVAYGAWPDPGRRIFAKIEQAGALSRAYPLGSMEATWNAALNALCGQLLDADWPTEDNDKKRVSLCLIDAGYGTSTDTVFSFCRTSQWKDRLMPSRGKGIGAKHRPMSDWPKEKGDKIGPDWRIRTNKARRQREVVLGVNYWKSFVAGRLAAPLGGSGCLMLPGENPQAHELISHHLTAEKRVRVSANGNTVDEWVWKVGQDNDLLDVVVGLHVAASIRGISTETGARTASPVERMSFAEMQRRARSKRTA